MSERTKGLYSLLRRGAVYEFVQGVLRPRASYRQFVERHVRPNPGARILDIGCGTAAILSYLPPVRYMGIDANRDYLRRARSRFGDAGEFKLGDAAGPFDCPDASLDVVLALGVLHHLDDLTASRMLHECGRVLRSGGRFVSHDPVLWEKQSRCARLFVRLDRGKHVRWRAEFLSLIEPCFSNVQSFLVKDSLRIPYTEIIFECTNAIRSGG